MSVKRKIIEGIIAKAERYMALCKVDRPMTDDELDEATLIQCTLPGDILAVKADLLDMFEEE